LANQELVILPSSERKLRKNALCLNQSAFSNFALYVVRGKINADLTFSIRGGLSDRRGERMFHISTSLGVHACMALQTVTFSVHYNYQQYTATSSLNYGNDIVLN